MFVIHKTDTGAVAPWEYLPAAEGTYQVGQMLAVFNSKVSPLSGESGSYDYLCMADKVCTEEDNVLPVVRVNKHMILKTTFNQDTAVSFGSQVQVDTNGLHVNSDAMTPAVEVVGLEGQKEGDTVYVRLK